MKHWESGNAFLTAMDVEFSDIRFPRTSCIGVTINMQQIAPTIALIPNFKYKRKMMAPIWTQIEIRNRSERDHEQVRRSIDRAISMNSWTLHDQQRRTTCTIRRRMFEIFSFTYPFIHFEVLLLSVGWPRCSDRSRRNSSRCMHPRPWGLWGFRYRPPADGNADPYPYRMASLPRRYSRTTSEEPCRKLMPEWHDEISRDLHICSWDSSMREISELYLSKFTRASHYISRFMFYDGKTVEYLKSCSQAYPSDAKYMGGRLAYRTLQDDRQENHDTQEISVSQNFGKRHGSLKKHFDVWDSVSTYFVEILKRREVQGDTFEGKPSPVFCWRLDAKSIIFEIAIGPIKVVASPKSFKTPPAVKVNHIRLQKHLHRDSFPPRLRS